MEAFPVGAIQRASQFGTSLPRVPIIPAPIRGALVLFFMPGLLRYINSMLSGERTGLLTSDQAQSLYEHLEPLRQETLGILVQFPRRPRWQRFLMGRWRDTMVEETGNLVDTLETLDCTIDATLHASLKTMVAGIEPRPCPTQRKADTASTTHPDVQVIRHSSR